MSKNSNNRDFEARSQGCQSIYTLLPKRFREKIFKLPEICPNNLEITNFRLEEVVSAQARQSHTNCFES